MSVRGLPTGKSPGESARRLFGSDESGVKGREFGTASMQLENFANSSKVSI